MGIIGSFALAYTAFRFDAKIHRIGNLINITHQHREIWSIFLNHPELGRVRASYPDLSECPPTEAEVLFVNLVILHLNSTYYALKSKTMIELDGLETDIIAFFSLPIPRAAWKAARPYQNPDFIQYVESILSRPIS
jgi:hypothetical protein